MSSGGLIYVHHIGTRDLRGVVLHEFGHVPSATDPPSWMARWWSSRTAD